VSTTLVPANTGTLSTTAPNDAAVVLARLHECRGDGATRNELAYHLGWPVDRVGAALLTLAALGHVFDHDHINGDGSAVVVFFKR